ncbi:hypothetical protein [Streptomyces sp. NPDC093093]|uniref:hypothetical protein n=1 Tax=Streptomyces sp. NPDC093093 TaxID=3366025 RepID=UPI00382161C7
MMREIAATAHALACIVIANRSFTDLYQWDRRLKASTERQQTRPQSAMKGRDGLVLAARGVSGHLKVYGGDVPSTLRSALI